MLKRFDYPQRNKRERGVLLRYLRHTSGYSRPEVTRLVAQWTSVLVYLHHAPTTQHPNLR